MADRAAKQKMVEANLRSVTQSCKGGVPIERLERDYRDLLGTSIPYKELGFPSLEAMIRGMPDVIRLRRNEMGQLTAMGVADQTTAHIASLVARQRPTKARKIQSVRKRFYISGSRGGNTRPFFNYSRNRFQPQASFRPAPQKETQASYESQLLRLNKTESAQSNRTDQHKPLYSASSKPEFKDERRLERPVVSLSKRQSPPPIPKSNFEIPPRFLRRQLNMDNTSRRPKPAIKSPLTSPVENCTMPNLFPTNTSTIPPPIESNHSQFLLSGGSKEEVQKFRSPKRKQTKEKRKIELPTPPLPNESPPIEFVQEYARAKGLECKFVTRQGGQRQKFYISILHLGNENYRSYPEECASTTEAEEYVASLAMKAILEEDQKPKFTITALQSEEQIHSFINRVEEIVSEKPNGIWDMKLPEEYENKFSESLPINWLSILQQNISTNIDIELYDTPHAYVLRCARNSGAATPSSTSSRTSSSYLNEDVVTAINEKSIENLLDKSLSMALPSMPPPLVFPESDQWDVLVTFVSSTMNIAVRLIDQAEYFNAMSTEMNNFYSVEHVSVKKPTIGKLYVAHQIIDDQHFYYRVRVDDRDTKEATCYFVDIGESESLSLNHVELYDLDKQFENLPFQAIHVSLDGLENYEKRVKFSNLVDKLLDKPLIAEIKRRIENQIVTVLYDTSGQEDLNLNDILWELTIEETLTTSLPEMGSTSMCFLTHANVEGEIYLRCNDPRSCPLEDEMEKNILKFEDAPHISRSELSCGNIYVTKYDDGNWYRTIFWSTSEANDEDVELFYVDYGNLSVAPWSHVKDLGCISKFLSSLPFQAKPCTLMGVPSPDVCWTENGLLRLYELAPEHRELIVKVSRAGTETSPPQVMLFIRNEEAVFISINEMLLCSKDLFSPMTVNGACLLTKPNNLPIHSENHTTTYDAENIPLQAYANNFVTSPSILWAPTPDAGNDLIDLVDDSPPSPEIPEIDHLFDVHITYVASPSNFVIQSLKSANALSSLLESLQTFYKAEENLCDMHLCLLKPENYYAALHKDGFWYRVKVKNIDEGEQVMAAVHFIDYGDFDTVNLSNLQPLYRQFKVLPCQAIKASLHGVKPIYNDWLAEDCIEVKELINERQFVSIIKSKQKNTVDEFGEWTLSICLIDVTSPEQDIYIHKLLIDKGLAAPTL